MVAPDVGLDPDLELSRSLHHTLMTLTQVRAGSGPLPRQQLKDKLELLVWLSAELRAAYGLLLLACLDAGVEPQELTSITGMSVEDIHAAGARRRPAAATPGPAARRPPPPPSAPGA